MVGKKSMAFFLHGHNQSDGGSNAGTLFSQYRTKKICRPFWSGSTKMVGLDQNGRQREGSVRVYTVNFVNAILAGIL